MFTREDGQSDEDQFHRYYSEFRDKKTLWNPLFTSKNRWLERNRQKLEWWVFEIFKKTNRFPDTDQVEVYLKSLYEPPKQRR